MAWTPFNSFLARPLECYFNAASAPATNSFFLILTLGGTITAASNLATVLAQEVSGNGYARANYDPGVGAYDAVQLRYEMPVVTVSFTATTAAIQFDKAVLIGGAASSGSSGELICFEVQSGTITIPAGSTYSFQIAFNAGGSGADVNAA